METAKTGDIVKVHYTGRLDDGTVFDTSREREPLEFAVGKKYVIAGFDRAVNGMSVGESKTVRIPAGEAYGLRDEGLVVNVEHSKFPTHITPEIGLHLQMKQPDGAIINMLIAGMNDDSITLDANHPFAGKDLTFDIELLDIAPGAQEGGASGPTILTLG